MKIEHKHKFVLEEIPRDGNDPAPGHPATLARAVTQNDEYRNDDEMVHVDDGEMVDGCSVCPHERSDLRWT